MSSSSTTTNDFKSANAAANDPDGWRCDGCYCRNKKEDIICVVCEAPNPTLSQEDIDRIKKEKEEEKQKLIAKFRSSTAAPKPTGFGVADSSNAASTFTFGQSSTAEPVGTGFVFGASKSEGAFAANSTAETVSPPSATSSFVFGAPSSTSSPSKPIVFGSGTTAAAGGGGGFMPTIESRENEGEKLKDLAEKPDIGDESLIHMGSVFVHGSGECDQLGLGDAVLERRKPTSIDKICMSTLGYKIAVTQIAVGALHTLALDSTTGKVFSWGCNDDGALGRLGPENQPRPIDGLEGVAVRSIAAGDNHSTFLDDAGRVWLCGTYKDSSGYLGFPDFHNGMSADPLKRSYDPMRVPGLGTASSRAIAIASGANHTLATVESSRGGKTRSRILEVYAWGNDEFGQLGHGGSGDENLTEEEAVLLKHTRRSKRATSSKLHPHPINWNKKERGSIDKVFASANCTFLSTEEGRVFGCGLNNFAQLGLGKTTAEPILCSTTVNDGTGDGPFPVASGDFSEWSQRYRIGCKANHRGDDQAIDRLPILFEDATLAIWLSVSNADKLGFETAIFAMQRELVAGGAVAFDEFSRRSLSAKDSVDAIAYSLRQLSDALHLRLDQGHLGKVPAPPQKRRGLEEAMLSASSVSETTEEDANANFESFDTSIGNGSRSATFETELRKQRTNLQALKDAIRSAKRYYSIEGSVAGNVVYTVEATYGDKPLAHRPWAIGLGYPVEVENLSSTKLGCSVKEIVGGSFHTVALTTEGEVFTWGRRDYSGLGGGNDDVTNPSKLSKLKNVMHVAAGGSHALACTKSGDFYTWGFGETHQLGNCPRDISKGATSSTDATDELSPYLVQSKQLESKFVLQVGGGSQHSVELAWNGVSVSKDDHMPVSVKTAARRLKGGEVKDVWLGSDDMIGKEVKLSDGTEGKITSKEKIKDENEPKHIYHRWFYVVTIPPSDPLAAAAAEPAAKRRRTNSGRPSSAASVSSLGEGGSHKATVRLLGEKEAKEAIARMQ
ncbi:Regulator of chromosome condensation [Perkinsus chesapeaki]|uniref:Regulator of chromosome condensation n=1 Tax=Perkinsus chesapeaki TaxID=330153 RepID=A0A7J6LY68_PERCH|nr:Regulator of chromosome condensation [Perkinsus chesapeaki]